MWNCWDWAYGQTGDGTHQQQISWSSDGHGSPSTDWGNAGYDYYKNWHASQHLSCSGYWDERTNWSTWHEDTYGKRKWRDEGQIEHKLSSVAAARNMSVEELKSYCRETGKKSIKGSNGQVAGENNKRTFVLHTSELLFVKEGVSFKAASQASREFLKPLAEFATWNIRMRPHDAYTNLSRVTIHMNDDRQDRNGVQQLVTMFFHHLKHIGPNGECLLDGPSIKEAIKGLVNRYVQSARVLPNSSAAMSIEDNPIKNTPDDNPGENTHEDVPCKKSNPKNQKG